MYTDSSRSSEVCVDSSRNAGAASCGALGLSVQCYCMGPGTVAVQLRPCGIRLKAGEGRQPPANVSCLNIC